MEREQIRDPRTVDPSRVAALSVTEATDDVAFIGEPRDDIKIVSQKHATDGVSLNELDTDVRVVENRLEITLTNRSYSVSVVAGSPWSSGCHPASPFTGFTPITGA
jgi:hypothetical protein